MLNKDKLVDGSDGTDRWNKGKRVDLVTKGEVIKDEDWCQDCSQKMKSKEDTKNRMKCIIGNFLERCSK